MKVAGDDAMKSDGPWPFCHACEVERADKPVNVGRVLTAIAFAATIG